MMGSCLSKVKGGQEDTEEDEGIKDLMEMKAMEFKEELGVREEPVSGMDAGVATPAAARGDVAGGGHLADLQKLKGGPIERN